MRWIAALLCLIALPANAGERIEGSVSVRDGDTIVVAGVPVRLNGVAAPEKSESGGFQATAEMVRLTTGTTVVCDLSGARSHDRWVGICYVGGRDVGAAIIAAGLARDCPRFSGGRYASIERPEAASLPLPKYCRR